MEHDDAGVAEPAGRDGSRLVVGFVLAMAAVAAFFAFGMPGMSHGDEMTGMPGMAATPETNVAALGVDAFAARMAEPASFLVNVHTGGRLIAGTDASIPLAEVVGDDRLPAALDTPILVYCKSGRMSREAADTLAAKGYEQVAFLDGGTDAWIAAGREVA